MTQEPLVLLPGMMCDGRLFAPQIAAFSAQRPVMVMTPSGETTMTGLANRVLEVTPPTFALAGLSMGGIIAMEIIRLAPDRVTRLALLDTNPLPDPPEKAASRLAQVNSIKTGELRRVMRDEMKPNYLADGPMKVQVLDLCMEMAETLGAKAFADQTAAIRNRPDQCETLRKISVPTLVLCGKDDTLCPIERHRLMHDLISNSILEIIPQAGHLPTLEQPQLTNKALNEWLKM
jgi:pimeloyl-ACP methyl ester carboxylesterase